MGSTFSRDGDCGAMTNIKSKHGYSDKTTFKVALVLLCPFLALGLLLGAIAAIFWTGVMGAYYYMSDD